MKLIYNLEASNNKEIVISHKVFYVMELNKEGNKTGNYILDESRTKESVIENNSMDKFVTGKDMSDYVRDHIGRKKWKVVISLGTINIFKKGTHQKDEVKPVAKKNKKNK